MQLPGGDVASHTYSIITLFPGRPCAAAPLAPVLNAVIVEQEFSGDCCRVCVSFHQFSRDQFIPECPSEKLRKELEEELKMDCEELRSHAWYHGAIPRQVKHSHTRSESPVPP